MQFDIKWVDSGRLPMHEPDARYPNGKHIPTPYPDEPSCQATLPYPAKRCGIFFVKCKRCQCTLAVTTAGRIDDPRTIDVPCRQVQH